MTANERRRCEEERRARAQAARERMDPDDPRSVSEFLHDEAAKANRQRIEYLENTHFRMYHDY